MCRFLAVASEDSVCLAHAEQEIENKQLSHAIAKVRDRVGTCKDAWAPTCARTSSVAFVAATWTS